MAHNKYTPPGKGHEPKTTHKDRKKEREEMLKKQAEQQALQQPVVEHEVVATTEDKDQLKRLGLIAGVVIVGLLFFMYYMFAWN